MDEGARVWKVYRKEANAHDNALLDGWSSTLDILLIFAGLFSAVATAFVIESYQLLQPDSAAYAAAALYILVSATNHSTGIVLPPPPDLQYASSLSRWINGLWFTSILLSLIVALLSILVKQWIGEYRARNLASAKSPHEWARRHEVYSQALNAWPVAELVSLLPVMLHLSLFLFFAGVVAFLWSLDTAIGIWIIVLGSSLSVFYVGCTLVPLWIPECPTSTPLVHQLRRGAHFCSLIILRVCATALPYVLKAKAGLIPRFLIRYRRSRTSPTTYQIPSILPLTMVPDVQPDEPVAMRDRLDRAINRIVALRRDRTVISQLPEERADELDASALSWLIFAVPDSDAVAVGYQALGAIHPYSSLAQRLRNSKPGDSDFSAYLGLTRSVIQCSLPDLIRVMRSSACMTPDRSTWSPNTEIFFALRTSQYPDALALTWYLDEVEAYSSSSISVTQTASPQRTGTLLWMHFIGLACQGCIMDGVVCGRTTIPALIRFVLPTFWLRSSPDRTVYPSTWRMPSELSSVYSAPISARMPCLGHRSYWTSWRRVHLRSILTSTLLEVSWSSSATLRPLYFDPILRRKSFGRHIDLYLPQQRPQSSQTD
ncbi:hypothetical protein EXIGLDRAFT_470420 [Exidia glandulosa HHB12029]|uniref:DUF6535 domain-containing protein n=1 Tax=Exidia glandulosa HHB12029 TaxID=1314781 RepID=A0A165JYX9_EXIGL|nr:hypothetical protein EXIGLDRAFT_470420 [Exidia glandulosa HHB12029]